MADNFPSQSDNAGMDDCANMTDAGARNRMIAAKRAAVHGDSAAREAAAAEQNKKNPGY